MLAELRQATDPKRLEELRAAFGDRLLKPAKRRRGLILNEQAVAGERELDGRFVLFTTRTALSDEYAFRLYGDGAWEGGFEPPSGNRTGLAILRLTRLGYPHSGRVGARGRPGRGPGGHDSPCRYLCVYASRRRSL